MKHLLSSVAFIAGIALASTVTTTAVAQEHGQAGQSHGNPHAGQPHAGQPHGDPHDHPMRLQVPEIGGPLGQDPHGQAGEHGDHVGTTEVHSAQVHGGEHAEHAGGHHALDPINWFSFDTTDSDGKPQFPMIALVINLLVLLFLYKQFPALLGVVAAIFTDGKTVPELLKSRRKAIGDAIVNAQKLLKEAKGRAAIYQGQLENLDADSAATREGMQEAGRAEKERIVGEAQEKAKRLQRDAAFLLEQEQKQVNEDLLNDTVERAVKEAETLLRAKVTQADQERLAEEFLDQLVARRAATAAVSVAPRPLTGDAE